VWLTSSTLDEHPMPRSVDLLFKLFEAGALSGTWHESGALNFRLLECVAKLVRHDDRLEGTRATPKPLIGLDDWPGQISTRRREESAAYDLVLDDGTDFAASRGMRPHFKVHAIVYDKLNYSGQAMAFRISNLTRRNAKVPEHALP
jgi:hypothetical protein